MRRNVGVVVALLVAGAILLFGAIVFAGTLSWQAVTSYTDNTAIPSAKLTQISYQTYYGPSASGPWTPGVVASPGSLSATVPDPAAGGTLWYTVDATLDGITGGKGVSVSKTVPFRTPKVPGNLTVN